MSRSIDDNGIWWYENTAGEKKKLLINPKTKEPYKGGETVHLNGKRFKEYRYDRIWASNIEYWPLKYMPQARNLVTYDKSYCVPTPTCISFSGGRTSGYMLKKIIDAHGGKLPKDVIVCFANTGKEMEPTLDFVQKCSEMWDVDINWLELDIGTNPVWQTKKVTYETASRNGEPFSKLLEKRHDRLPTLFQRVCTIELKINVISRYMRSLGYKEWYSALGLRYDEPKRVSDSKNNSQKNVNIAPLYEAKVTNEDVLEFWRKSNFDLELPSIDGKTVAGNCDLCFLKGTKTLVNIIKEKPELADWWIEKEEKAPIPFRNGRSYIKLVDLSKQEFNPDIDDTTYTCFCHD